jgi:hypothetical protein
VLLAGLLGCCVHDIERGLRQQRQQLQQQQLWLFGSAGGGNSSRLNCNDYCNVWNNGSVYHNAWCSTFHGTTGTQLRQFAGC